VADRNYGLADRIDELGQDPAAAYAAAKAAGAPVGQFSPVQLAPPDPLEHDQAAAPPAPADIGTGSRQAAPGKPRPAPAAAPDLHGTGTLADTIEQKPDLAPVRPTMAPLEDVPTFGQTFEAARRMMRSDRSDFDEIMLRDGYAPIVKALNLRDSENPARFYSPDPATAAKVGTMGQPSDLATAAQQGENPIGSTWLASRDLQERLIVDQIRQRRAQDPNFLKGVPDTVDGLHTYFLEQEKAKRAGAAATVSRSQGLSGALAQLSGGAVESFHDPLNLATLPIGGGGKTLVQIAAREALTQGVLELAQQPIVAGNRQELGEHLTLGEAATNVGIAAAGGGVLGGALHAAGTGGKALAGAAGRGYDVTVAKIFAALPEAAQAKWASRMKVGNMPASEFFSDLSNRDLAEFAHDAHQGKLTPDETAAGNVLERAADIGDTSPFQHGPAGDVSHETSLAQAIKDLEDPKPELADLPSVSASEGTGAATPAAATERPPAALSTARRPQVSTAPVDTAGAIAAFKDRVRTKESGGNDHAQNPKSSARGRYNFTDGTFRDYYRRVFGQDPGAHPSHELKDNGQIQERLMDALTHDNAAKLTAMGESVNTGNLYAMHVLGAGDGPKVFKADPSTPIERILSEDVLRRNPYFRGKSASEIIAWAHDKMGGSTVSVAPRGGAGALDAATEDPLVAQLNAESLQLEQSAIGSAEPVAGLPPMYGRSYPASDILVDADRFQFKAGGDALGVTDRLRGVDEWNPMYAGRIVAWEDQGGRVFVADGHQRVGLAKRLEEQGHTPIGVDAITLREADGVSSEDARVYAALKNIAEGTGTAVDAAKVIRDAGAHVLEHLPPKSALVRDGAALARLSDAAFGAVYNDVLPPDFAAVIGHLLPDRPEAHEGMVDLLVKTDPANRGQAESIVRQGIAAGFHHETQNELFGARELVSSLMLERAKVLEKGLAKLRRLGLVHKTAAAEADTLEAVGSSIAREQSAKEAQANAEAVDIVSRLAFSRGPVADALNGAARDLAGGHKLGSVVDRFVNDVRGLDLATVSREVASNDASRLAPDGAGRGGDPGEEGSQLSAQHGDPEQPSLIELEHATERFSNPDGPAVKSQAESLVHDLRTTLTRRERIQAATAELEHTKPGEFRTVEPFPDEPGYHRFRYVADDGTVVGGNYTVDGNLIEGFNIGDTHNPVKLGPIELRKLFALVHQEHPEVTYVHAYRKSGARLQGGTGEQEIWFELTDNGVKFRGSEDPRPTLTPEEAQATATALDLVDQVDPAIADRLRQEVALRTASPMRPGAIDAHGTGGLGLFDAADQPSFRLSDEGEPVSAEDLLKELDDDDKAIKAMKDCL
jgi:hypothetical protein